MHSSPCLQSESCPNEISNISRLILLLSALSSMVICLYATALGSFVRVYLSVGVLSAVFV